jgi:putative ABC transport system ATP-binding protein
MQPHPASVTVPAEPSPSAPAVVCEAVTKSFLAAGGPVWALRGVDLTVASGAVTMLVGPSGCGKTTLLSVIAGILGRDGGACRVFGIDVERLGHRDQLDFRARTIGFIFQQFHLLPTLSVVNNVAIPLMINGISRRDALTAARTWLDRVGLGDRCEDLPTRLSGGQQQRVAIARALVHRPRLVVCDEPTSALDHDTGQRIMETMREIVRDEGTTLLIVTHDSRILAYADHVARMDDGRIVSVTPGAANGVAANGAAAVGAAP